MRNSTGSALGSKPRNIEVKEKLLNTGVEAVGSSPEEFRDFLSEYLETSRGNPIMGLKKVGSIGIPFPDTDMRIVDLETGTKDMGVGEPGELIMNGPLVMQGYQGQQHGYAVDEEDKGARQLRPEAEALDALE